MSNIRINAPFLATIPGEAKLELLDKLLEQVDLVGCDDLSAIGEYFLSVLRDHDLLYEDGKTSVKTVAFAQFLHEKHRT